MHNPLRLAHLILVLCGFVLIASPARARDTVEQQKAKIQKMHDEVLADLYEVHPGARAKIARSVGYAVFSNVGINLIFASFAGGHGVVIEKGLIHDTKTYMKMGSAGIGLGLGVKDFRGVFVFYDQAKLKTFVEKGWDFGAQADAAAKSGEKGDAAAVAANLTAGVEVFQLTKNGLALQATLQGTKYWKDDDLN